ncbi:MAG: asparagine synthetase A [Nanoarchaeota archaeon]|nr:asparagine synthetase A [Nanoarchaeota archaeon]
MEHHHTRKDFGMILAIQTTALKSIHDFFHERGFYQIMPVIISPITDPLAHSTGPATITYKRQKLQLTKSMIFHKQLALMAEGHHRIYCVSPNIRLEHDKCNGTGRHLLEFSQVDFEVKEATADRTMLMVEELVMRVIREVKQKHEPELEMLGRELTIPRPMFPVYDSREMREKFGEDFEDKLSGMHSTPFWIVNHDREFYDREDPDRPDYYLNYDLVWPEGYGEALSGGEREFEFDRIRKRMDKLGKFASYKEYMRLAKLKQLKPSAGGGIGVERLIRFLCGKPHISDVVLFPKVPGEKIMF